MKRQTWYSSAAFSVAAFLTAGCASRPYTQVQLGYANMQHERDLGGHVDLLCVRARGGAKVGTEEPKREEFRLGADICYGKLPDSTSQQKYSVDVPVVGEKEADVQGTTSSNVVKIAIPFIEYKLWGLGANFPRETLPNSRLRSPLTKDLSLDFWLSGGYTLDFTLSETDYSTSGGSIDNIPGIDVDGKFYGELTSEITLFGRYPLSMSLRLDEDKYFTPSAIGGYKIQW